MNLKNYFCSLSIVLLSSFGASLFAQTPTIANISSPLEFCEGDMLSSSVGAAPIVTGTFIAASGTWTIDKVVVPDSYIFSYNDTTRLLYYRVSILAGTFNDDTTYVYSVGKSLKISKSPHITSLSLNPKPCVGDTITAKVTTDEMGISFQWYLDATAISGATTAAIEHELVAADNGTVLSVKLTGANGCVSTFFTPLTTFAGAVTTPPALDIVATDPATFPVVLGLDFDDPVIDYTTTPANGFHFITYNLNGAAHVNGSMENIYIPYLDETFNCRITVLASGEQLPLTLFVANRTIFLDEGGFVLANSVSSFNGATKDNIKLIGADTASNGHPKTVLYPNTNSSSNGSNNYRFIFNAPNTVLQNLIIDGQNGNYYQYFIHMTSVADGLLFKDLRFRNVRSTANNYSLMNLLDGNTRNLSIEKYFINVTIESTVTTGGTSYEVININTTDGLYFRNLDIQTTAGRYAIGVANSNNYTENTGPKNVIFAGTLKIVPRNNQILVLKYSSRHVSFPEEYRYARMRTNWTESNSTVTNSAFFLNNSYDGNTQPQNTYVLFDLKESTFIVNSTFTGNNTSANPAVNYHLNRIQSLYNNANIKAACNLPDPLNIKIAPLHTSSITIPDYGPMITNIIFTNTTGTTIATTDLIQYPDAARTITTNATNRDYVKIHNLDFHTPLSLSLTTVTPIFPSGINRGNFHNCKFTGLETVLASSDMSITANPIIEVTLTEDGQTINGSSSDVTLHVETTDFPVDIYYSINGAAQPMMNLSAATTNLPVPSFSASWPTGDYVYTLDSIFNGSTCSQISGTAKIYVLDCSSVTYEAIDDTIQIELPYGVSSTVVVLDTPTVVKPTGLDITMTSDAPGKTVTLGRGIEKYTWTVANDCNGDVETCTQWVIVNYPPCGINDSYWTLEGGVPTEGTAPNIITAIDYEGYVYQAVRIGVDCWTQENLQSTKYSDGTDIDGTYKYYNEFMYPDSNANADIFGLLYNWEAAVRPSEPTNQGVCPDGWYLPSEAQYAALNSHLVEDLRSTKYWLTPGTNLTGFTALPAGMYDETADAFFYLMGDAFFWAFTNSSTSTALACHLYFQCSTALLTEITKGAGLSVRCIKK